MATNGNSQHQTNQFGSVQQDNNALPGASTVSDQSGASANNNLGKDEVAWFFVEQYYTTLSKNPEKLHLFYSKRSQFVYGQEAEVAEVSVGRQNIQERIKSLDLQDTCKVRISNVDSQSSFDNIVIQVIGETSNKVGDDPKKFLQTFVLAQQPSGYFVLNDILRYLDEEREEDQAELADQEAAVELPSSGAPAEAHEEPETKPEPVDEEPTLASSSLDPVAVDQKLEEVSATAQDTPSVNGGSVADTPAEPAAAVPETVAAPEADSSSSPEETIQKLEEEDTKEPEKPTDPSPTPVATRQPPPKPAAPAQPSKPMTWANRAAAAAGPRPAVPSLPKTATPAVPAQSRPAAKAPAAASPSAAAASPAQPTENPAAAAPVSKDTAGWQTAGNDSKRHNRPQSISGAQVEKEGTLGYLKYVTEKVQEAELKAALAQYGEVVYFDINRSKSCAFVEYATTAGYQAAAAASPFTVNGESITIEPRRPKSNAYGGVNYSSGRGNLGNRGGRGGFDGRSASQGGRGNFGGASRGRGGAPRGRGASQAANA